MPREGRSSSGEEVSTKGKQTREETREMLENASGGTMGYMEVGNVEHNDVLEIGIRRLLMTKVVNLRSERGMQCQIHKDA
jgi:hypothetical protein